jgi:uncharacterized protein YdaU (DUF1376 family)
MHYFEHNIKDYRADAFTLTMIQHGAYRQLIDQYYLNEKPLTLDLEVLCADLLVRGEDEKKAIVFILGKFFSKTEDGYVHKRCNTVIQAFKDKSDKNRNNAVKRWSKVKDANALPQECERNANQEPLTINKETKTKVNTPEGVDTNLWNDYLKIRKAKKAPITETAIQALVREADKAGKSLSQAITICVENNWVGFKAEWESVKQAPSDQPKKWPGI